MKMDNGEDIKFSIQLENLLIDKFIGTTIGPISLGSKAHKIRIHDHSTNRVYEVTIERES